MPDGCGRSVMGSDVPDDEPRIVDKIGDRGAAEGRARLAPAAPAKVERVGGKPAAGEEGEPVVPDGRVGEITVDEQHRRTRDSFRPCMQHSDSLELQSLDHRPRRDNFLAGGNTPSDMTLPPLEPTMQPYSRHILVSVGGFCSPDRRGAELYRLLPSLLQREGLLFGPNRVKRGETPCLGVCTGGPIVVVYPEGVWYGGVTPALLERIVVEHLGRGRVVREAVFHRLTPP